MSGRDGVSISTDYLPSSMKNVTRQSEENEVSQTSLILARQGEFLGRYFHREFTSKITTEEKANFTGLKLIKL